MKFIAWCLLLLMSGCKSITSCFIIDLDEVALQPSNTTLVRTPEYQKEIDEMLAADADNKKWERIYLKEIEAAQKHQDIGAYEFFLREYIELPRLKIPKWMKAEPGYVPSITIEELENR